MVMVTGRTGPISISEEDDADAGEAQCTLPIVVKDCKQRCAAAITFTLSVLLVT